MLFIIMISTIARFFYYQNNIMFKDILTNFDYFMYGAIPAYFYVYYKESTLRFIGKISNLIKTAIILTTLFVVISFSHFDFYYMKIIEPYIFGLLFSSTLLIIIPKDTVFKISDSNMISRLGIYTYGLYLLHPISINFIIQLNTKLNLKLSENYLFIFIFCSSLLLVILTSSISYHFFEKQFLKLKDKI
jgi:peptidoglycan/LPS O-acetylase OafA/YrhL